jgi:hypothetical protein
MGSAKVTLAGSDDFDHEALQGVVKRIADDLNTHNKIALTRVAPEIAGAGEALRLALKTSMPVGTDLRRALNLHASSIKANINAQMILRNAKLDAISGVISAQYGAERVLAAQRLVNTSSVLEAARSSLLSQADLHAVVSASAMNRSFAGALKAATQAAVVPSLDDAHLVADLMRSGSLDADAWNAIGDELIGTAEVSDAIDSAADELQADSPGLSRAQARGAVVALVYLISLFGVASLLVVTDGKWLAFLMAATGISARDGAEKAGELFDAALPEEPAE